MLKGITMRHRLLSALLTMGIGGVSAPTHGASPLVEQVETTNAVLSFKATSGDLIGVQWKKPRLEVIAEARLGENFRLQLPTPEYETNYFNSRDQVVRRVEKANDRVVLHYGPLKNA